MPSGEQVFVFDKQKAKDLSLPGGDLMMFDNGRIAVCAYDASGRITSETFYDEKKVIDQLLQLKRDLLTLALPL